MKKWMLLILGFAIVAMAAACGGGEEKVVVRITDKQGELEPREITVEYVNERIDKMPPHLLPDVPGEDGKRQFVEEILRKELLVVRGYRQGIHEEPAVERVREFSRDDKARSMLFDEMIYDKAEPTTEDVEKHNIRRETTATLLQIVVRDEEEAWDAYRRVTEGGEDFGAVAREVSEALSAPEGGKLEPKLIPDYHPIVALQISELEPGKVTEPVEIGGVWHIYKVVTKKPPARVPELDDERLAGVKPETRLWMRTVAEHNFTARLKEDAELEYNNEALTIAAERIGEQLDEIVPDNVEELSREERMEIARTQVIPEFSDEELEMELVSYKVGAEERAWTLADFQQMLEETPGMEGPKTEETYGLKLFIWRKIMNELFDYEIEQRGYKDSDELKRHLEMREEEYVVNAVYTREVKEQVEVPTGDEIRTRFRNNREDYAEPPKVDLRQLIVPTEADANMLRQRITSGEATFEELVTDYSIDEWSKPRGGLIEGYHQGERKLEYLQDVVFDLEEGELSDPFEAPGGYAIVKVLKKYPRRLMEMSELGDHVKQQIIAERTEERLHALLDEIRESVEIEWFEENIRYVKDPAEAIKEKRANRFVATG
ncbi:MAG: hypothetical protein GF400_03820 [Candidatus Eisenbacteria bacterium]|nr:hypothetical protein [Candidatus Eisenbacteria bacterium]